MQLAKSDMGNQKCQTDIQQLSGRKEEVESSLVVHLDEKGKLQRELVRSEMVLFYFGEVSLDST